MERAGKKILEIADGKGLQVVKPKPVEWLWSPESGDEVELAFLARALIQITLPHSDPGDVPCWVRQNGNLTLVLTRTNIDRKTRKMIGYPYGTLPRLLLYWLNSEVVRTKSRRIELGDSLSQFMCVLGMNSRNGTGIRSDSRRLRDQMDRLFSASIRFKRSTDHNEQDVVGAIVEKSDLWWDGKRPQQGYLWQSWVQVSETFYQTITTSAVPLNMGALRTLKRSPLALDLYTWLCYRNWGANKAGKVQRIPWVAVHAQFGSDYADMFDFRRKAEKALLKIVQVQPELRVSVTQECLEIHPSVLVIPVPAGFRIPSR